MLPPEGGLKDVMDHLEREIVIEFQLAPHLGFGVQKSDGDDQPLLGFTVARAGIAAV